MTSCVSRDRLALAIINKVCDKAAMDGIDMAAEKDAAAPTLWASFLNKTKGLTSGLRNAATLATGAALGGGKAISKIPSSLGWLALLGSGVGALGTMGMDALKERMTSDDPETKFLAKEEAEFSGREREVSDSLWMDRARKKRDELRRGMRKMTPEEYSSKYNELMDILAERE